MSQNEQGGGVTWRSGLCPFCLQPVEPLEPTIRCRVCDTFCHRWCWRFNGRRCPRPVCEGRL